MEYLHAFARRADLPRTRNSWGLEEEEEAPCFCQHFNHVTDAKQWSLLRTAQVPTYQDLDSFSSFLSCECAP